MGKFMENSGSPGRISFFGAFFFALMLSSLAAKGAFAQFFLPGVQPDVNSKLKDKNVLLVNLTSSHDKQQVAASEIWDSIQKKVGFRMTKTTNPAFFTPANLAPFNIIIMSYIWKIGTDYFTTAEQRNALQQFRANGGNFLLYHTSLALHLSENSTNPWQWAKDSLCGMDFIAHQTSQQGTMYKTAAGGSLPVTQGLPTSASVKDEWYTMSPNPADLPNTTVLYTVDEKSLPSGAGQGAMKVHPVVWTRDYPKGGHAYCNILDHEETYVKTQLFRTMLLRGAEYLAGYGPVSLDKSLNSIEDEGIGSMIFQNQSMEVVLPGPHQVSIWSPAGKLLYSAQGEGVTFYTPEVLKQAGLYIITLKSKNRKITQKFFVQ